MANIIKNSLVRKGFTRLRGSDYSPLLRKSRVRTQARREVWVGTRAEVMEEHYYQLASHGFLSLFSYTPGPPGMALPTVV